jgi:hypothetical protein
VKIASVQLKLDYYGVRALLRSDDVQADLHRRAEAVATAARSRGIMVEGEPGDRPVPIDVQDAKGGTRARCLVVIDHPSGLAIEAKHRLLVGSLDAARHA